MIDLTIFNNLQPNHEKLINFGFYNDNGKLVFKKDLNEEFYSIFTLYDNKMSVDVYEKDTNDKLQLFYLPDITGSFIGEINSLCENIAREIVDNCFEKNRLYGDYAYKITEYIGQTYGDKIEHLWEKFPEDGIWRRCDNKKWYALIMKISKNKLGLNSNEKVDVLDIRADRETLPKLVDNKQIFAGYHMNKKTWITVCLDGSISLEKIYEFIDKSYILAKEK